MESSSYPGLIDSGAAGTEIHPEDQVDTRQLITLSIESWVRMEHDSILSTQYAIGRIMTMCLKGTHFRGFQCK